MAGSVFTPEAAAEIPPLLHGLPFEASRPRSLDDWTPDAARELTARHGIDVATALLYEHVRQSPRHATFIRRIEQYRDEPTPSVRLPADTLVGIVPAAFYREMPRSGADGRVLRETASRLGLACELVPIHSTGTLTQNATIIRDWLARHRQRRIVLISLCKGGADLKFALQHHVTASELRPVQAWINVCGTVDGSPFAAWLLASKPRFIAAWLYFKCQRHDFRILREIAPAPDGPLASPLVLPAGLRFVSIAGFPLRRHLSNGFMRRCHRFISPAGPTDGGMMLLDAARLPGALYPVWGADHYLRPAERAAAILTAVFAELAAECPRDQPANSGHPT